MSRKLVAEFLGTFWLVLCGCGAAVLAADFGAGGIGLLGVSLAFGLAVTTMAYAVGHISGAHFNPAVTVGILAAGRLDARAATAYVMVQVIGACAAALLLSLIASGSPEIDLNMGGVGAIAANGYGARSPGGYGLLAAFITELVMTFFFLVIILGSTSRRAFPGPAPLAIGLSLTLIHLVSIPVTNTSVNPARSTGPALLAGGEALSQLWLFWLAPLLGAVIAGLVLRHLDASKEAAISQHDATWVA